MDAATNTQPAPPIRPPSLSAGEREMRDYYAAHPSPRPAPDPLPYLTPYLGLRARLSQIWINRWTVLLLLVLIRTLFAIASLDDNLGSARKQALSACNSVEHAGSVMASMPHYMSDGVNQLTADGIDKAIDGLKSMLLLTVTGVEEIILFIINLLTSTYVCLITFAIAGSLHVAIDIAEDVGDFLNSTVKAIGHDIGDAVDDFDDGFNKFLAGITDVGSFFAGRNLKPPTINLDGSIAKLDALQLPADYDQDLMKLNRSIPTFEDVHNFTNNAIRFPFEEVKKLLAEAIGNHTTNRSLFPVPPKERLTFCSDDDGIDDFFDSLVHIEQLAKKIFLAVLIILAIAVCIPMAWREIRRWRFMQARASLVRSEAHDPMDAVYLVSRPYSSDAGVWAASYVSSERAKNLIRWTVAYATTVPALFVLALAIAGLLGCLCQYILLKAIEKEVPALEQQVAGFTDKVVASLNNASTQWALGTNDVINTTNVNINKDVFGWVNVTTGAVNNTLNVFVDEMTKGLDVTFGGTPLYDPIHEVLNCLVLLKITGIQKALTWVSDHAHINFPQLPMDTFSLGTLAKVSDGSDSILAAGPGETARGEISDIVKHVTDMVAKTIRQEAIISTCVLIIWFLIVLIGIARSLFLVWRPGHTSAVTLARRRGSMTPPLSAEKDELAFPWLVPSDVPMREMSRQETNHSTPYTLTRRPLPTMPRSTVADSMSETGHIGQVGHNVNAATRRPDHLRASSYGSIVLPTPIWPK